MVSLASTTMAVLLSGLAFSHRSLLVYSLRNGETLFACSSTSAAFVPPYYEPPRRRCQPRIGGGLCVASAEQSLSSDSSSWYKSHVEVIKSFNLAGTVNDGEDKQIAIRLGDGPNLVAVTGETGSGKSLLIAKVAEICTGGKATSSYVPAASDKRGTQKATVEMVLRLSEPHLSRTRREFDRLGLDASLLMKDPRDSMGTLVLKRTLSVENTRAARLKSLSEVNGQPVTVKALRSLASPLVAIVDAPAAATALAKPNPRLAVIDTQVPDEVMTKVKDAMIEYRKCRARREKLEQELASRVLPPSFSETNDEKDLELLQHWVVELNVFEERMVRFCDDARVPVGKRDTFFDAVHALTSSSWLDNSASPGDKTGMSFSSLLYANLVEFREAVKSLDAQVQAAHTACDALGSLSVQDSAKTALERARNSLFDAVGRDENEEGPLFVASERSHELLNVVEEALEACIQSMEDDKKGLINVLEDMRSTVPISLEDIDAIIGDWNTLARKHAISPYVLPSCHKALQSQLDGNVEARSLLPGALEKEKVALSEFEAACQVLTDVRRDIAERLSRSVTQRMPALGFGGSTFEARFYPSVRKCTDFSVYGGGPAVGVDAVDFMFHHGADSVQKMNGLVGDRRSNGKVLNSRGRRGGKLEVVGSAGEKARLLLAIETELPGSIGASCGSNDRSLGEAPSSDGENSCPPVAVIYDEIDAHVGGRAAVSLANMLANQSRQRSGAPSKARGQVVSITHSPSVAAVADLHVVVQKKAPSEIELDRGAQENAVPVQASTIEGPARRKELARMASGDLAVDEAEVFADALIRDGTKRKQDNMPGV